MLSSGKPPVSSLPKAHVFLQAKQRLLSDQEQILWSTHQSLTQSQSHESELQRRVSELQAMQQTTAQKVILWCLSVPVECLSVCVFVI